MNPKIESEKALEHKLCAEIKKIGGWAIKLLSSQITGLPDRLCLLPNGRFQFVELKTTGKKPTKIQLVIHKRLEALGFPVLIIDSSEKINILIKNICVLKKQFI